MRRGSVHWANLDKRRPAIVVSPDRRNLLANNVIVVPCSTRQRPMPWHVSLRAGEGGLARACVAKCEEVVTVSKEALDAEAMGPVLAPHRMLELERALLLALGIDLSAHG